MLLALRESGQGKGLLTLNLSRNVLGVEGSRALVSLCEDGNAPVLKELRLDHMEIRDQVRRRESGENMKKQRLNVVSVQPTRVIVLVTWRSDVCFPISVASLTVITVILSLSLFVLFLSFCLSLRLSVQIAKVLAPGLSLLRGLKSLHLAHNKIGCVGCSALSDALFMDVGDHGDGVSFSFSLNLWDGRNRCTDYHGVGTHVECVTVL